MLLNLLRSSFHQTPVTKATMDNGWKEKLFINQIFRFEDMLLRWKASTHTLFCSESIDLSFTFEMGFARARSYSYLEKHM